MALDLQKLALRRLVEHKSSDFYSKLSSNYFSGANLSIYNKIYSFYKANLRIPSMEEFSAIHKEEGLSEYYQTEILSEQNKYDEVADEFLLGQLQDYYIREETIDYLSKFLDNLENLEKIEIVDSLQNHLLKLNNSLPVSDELYDVGELSFIPNGDDFSLFPSGMSNEYDSVNGGLGLEELVLLGGRRGSGKSIISLNLAYKRFLQKSTVAFFTIEMRYKEVYDRLLSIISGVPFLDIYRNKLEDTQKLQIIKAKLKRFYKEESAVADWYKDLCNTRDFSKFEKRVKLEKPPLTDNRLYIIDDSGLTLNRLDYFCNKFAHEHDDFNMSVVDYLNIIKHEDSRDWKTQILFADELKTASRKYKQTILSPYQIDSTGEARFSKGILDSADRSFIFMPAKEGENREQENKLEVMTTKIRNGKHMSFDVHMDWPCVRIDSALSQTINSKPHKVAMYGDDDNNKKRGRNEVSRDV